MTYKQTTEFLFNSLPEFQNIGQAAYKPGLERTEEFNRMVGSPDRKFKSIHVAGTNGKGSTSHIIASVLTASGRKTGLYTSPHLLDFRERIKIDGVMISQNEVVDFVAQHKQAMVALRLSFFEMTVVMAFDHFARHGVEMAVIEVGLGGRLDSTNIIRPILSVITNIGLDHTALLGDTVEKIAVEKGGIIKSNVAVVVGEHGASDPLFEQQAHRMNSELIYAQDRFRVLSAKSHDNHQCFDIDPFGRLELDLLGAYQRNNIITALAALEQLGIERSHTVEGCAKAAQSTGLGGRWQICSLSPLTVLDTGHNSHGIAHLVEQIESTAHRELYMVIGFVADKELDSIFELLPRNGHYIFTQAAIERALSGEELKKIAKKFNLDGVVISSVAEAIEQAQLLANDDDMIFIGGSTFVVAEAKKFIQNQII